MLTNYAAGMNEQNASARWIVTIEEHGIRGTEHVDADTRDDAVRIARTNNPGARIIDIKPNLEPVPEPVADPVQDVKAETPRKKTVGRGKYSITLPALLFSILTFALCVPSLIIGGLLIALGPDMGELQILFTLGGIAAMIAPCMLLTGVLMICETCKAVGDITRSLHRVIDLVANQSDKK